VASILLPCSIRPTPAPHNLRERASYPAPRVFGEGAPRNDGAEEVRGEGGVLAVDEVGDHRPEPNAIAPCLLDQVPRQLRLGPKPGILLALGKARCRPIGFDPERDVTRAVGPMARHRHHPVGGEANLADVLLGRKGNAVAALAIASFVDDEHASTMGAQGGMLLPQLKTAGIEGSSIPGRIMQEVGGGAAYDCRGLGRPEPSWS
jgi:hypothetical protein